MSDEASVKRLATLEAVALAPARLVYSVWIALAFLAVGVAALVLLALLPGVARRRAAARAAARAFLRLAGMPLRVKFLERLPPGQCVVVCNHASYLDGIVLAAARPPGAAGAGRGRRAARCRARGASSPRSSRRSRAARQRLRGWRRSCAIGRAPRSSRRSASPISHVAPILPAHPIERVRNLPERADLDGLHELGEHVPAAGGELLERLQRRGRARRVARLEGTHRRHLSLLLFLARADQLRALVLIERVGSRQVRGGSG